MRAFRVSRSLLSSAVMLCLSLASAGCGGGAREGWPAPGFSLRDQGGKERKLEDFRGRAVMLVFWTPWAGPCRLSVPHWGRISRKYSRKGLAVLAVTVFDDAGTAGKVLREGGGAFPALAGNDAVTKAYLGKGEVVLPVVFIVDGKGRIARRVVGYQRAEDLEPEVERVLAGLPPPGGDREKR